MSAFKWYLMSEEEPPYGNCEYVIRGHNGELNVARGYGCDKYGGNHFVRHDYEHVFIWAKSVYAWAEIPSLEDERVDRCADCKYCDELLGHPYWCGWWANSTEENGFCHEFGVRESE